MNKPRLRDEVLRTLGQKKETTQPTEQNKPVRAELEKYFGERLKAGPNGGRFERRVAEFADSLYGDDVEEKVVKLFQDLREMLLLYMEDVDYQHVKEKTKPEEIDNRSVAEQMPVFSVIPTDEQLERFHRQIAEQKECEAACRCGQ